MDKCGIDVCTTYRDRDRDLVYSSEYISRGVYPSSFLGFSLFFSSFFSTVRYTTIRTPCFITILAFLVFYFDFSSLLVRLLMQLTMCPPNATNMTGTGITSDHGGLYYIELIKCEFEILYLQYFLRMIY